MYKVHGYHVTPNVIIIEWEQGGAQIGFGVNVEWHFNNKT